MSQERQTLGLNLMHDSRSRVDIFGVACLELMSEDCTIRLSKGQLK